MGVKVYYFFISASLFLYMPFIHAQTKLVRKGSIVKENVSCKVLGATLIGTHGIKVQCGATETYSGFVDANTRIERISLLVKDQKTDKERRIFHTINLNRDGGLWERLGHNRYGEKYYTGKKGLPLALYVPGGCGSRNLTLWAGGGMKKDRNGVKMGLRNFNELKKNDECSWLGGDTAWRYAVPGIKKHEDVLSVTYELPSDAIFYHDKWGNRKKGSIATYSTQSDLSDFSCETLSPDPILVGIKDARGKNTCSRNKRDLLCVYTKGALCSGPYGLEHVGFPKVVCSAEKDKNCPDITDCVFGDNGMYYNKNLKFMKILMPPIRNRIYDPYMIPNDVDQ